MNQDHVEAMNKTWRLFITFVITVALSIGAVLALVQIRLTSSVTASASNATSSVGVLATYSYTCCSSSFVNTVYHPGQVLALHWVRVIYQPGENSRYTIILKEKLSGPFSSVETLKSTVMASPKKSEPIEISAPVIRISNTKVRSPISLIHIPLNAAAGYYNLFTGIYVNTMGVGSESATIIRISS